MRIVGGEYRGRPLAAPKTQNIRPTTDRTRESLFNILAHAHHDKLVGGRFLDLFAGSGAVGIEAMSRGAMAAVFVENSTEGRGLLRQNFETFSIQARAKILRRDATTIGPIGPMPPFTIAFADPPYGKGLGERALIAAADGNWFAEGALIILEEQTGQIISLDQRFDPIETRKFGETEMHLFDYAGTS